MDDKEIVERISQLAAEEQRLEEAHVGEGLSDDELARKRELEVTLDQLWDLLRQRRAKRSAGQDPDAAAAALRRHRRGLSAVARRLLEGARDQSAGIRRLKRRGHQPGEAAQVADGHVQPVERVAPDGDLAVARRRRSGRRPRTARRSVRS